MRIGKFVDFWDVRGYLYLVVEELHRVSAHLDRERFQEIDIVVRELFAIEFEREADEIVQGVIGQDVDW